MYKTILVPIDLTEDELTSKAVRHAVNLAKQPVLKFIYSCFTHFFSNY